MIYDEINMDGYKKIINSNLTSTLDQDTVVFSNDSIIIYKNLFSMNKKILSRINGKINDEFDNVKIVFDKYLLCSSLYKDECLLDFSLNELKKCDHILIKDNLIYFFDNYNTHTYTSLYNSDLELLVRVEYRKNKSYVYDSKDNLIKVYKGTTHFDNLLNLYNNSYLSNKTLYINPHNLDIITLNDNKNESCSLVFKDKYLIKEKNNLKIEGILEISNLKDFRTHISDDFIFIYSIEHGYYNMFINNNYDIINSLSNSFEEVDSNTLIKEDLNGKFSIIDKNALKKLDQLYDNISYVAGMFKLKINDKYALMDDKLNMITDYHDTVDILNKYFYKIVDNSSQYVRVFSKGKEIFSYLKKDTNINLTAKDHLLLVEKKDSSMVINDTGDVIINPVRNKIILLSDKEILIDGHLFNLEQEYINVKYEYYLDEYFLDQIIKKEFLTNEERKKYIDKLEIIKNEAYNRLDSLNMEYEKNKVKQKR